MTLGKWVFSCPLNWQHSIVLGLHAPKVCWERYGQQHQIHGYQLHRCPFQANHPKWQRRRSQDLLFTVLVHTLHRICAMFMLPWFASPSVKISKFSCDKSRRPFLSSCVILVGTEAAALITCSEKSASLIWWSAIKTPECTPNSPTHPISFSMDPNGCSDVTGQRRMLPYMQMRISTCGRHVLNIMMLQERFCFCILRGIWWNRRAHS